MPNQWVGNYFRKTGLCRTPGTQLTFKKRRYEKRCNAVDAAPSSRSTFFTAKGVDKKTCNHWAAGSCRATAKFPETNVHLSDIWVLLCSEPRPHCIENETSVSNAHGCKTNDPTVASSTSRTRPGRRRPFDTEANSRADGLLEVFRARS